MSGTAVSNAMTTCSRSVASCLVDSVDSVFAFSIYTYLVSSDIRVWSICNPRLVFHVGCRDHRCLDRRPRSRSPLPQRGSSDAAQRAAVDEDGIARGLRKGIEELQQQCNKTGFPASGASTDSDFLAWSDGQVNIAEGQVRGSTAMAR